MEFLSDEIGERTIKELRAGRDAKIAVAYFSPDKKTLMALKGLGSICLVISDEFSLNNPFALEQLQNATILCVPPKSKWGKLHAKVLIVTRRSGSTWVLLGSANLTQRGLFENQEACVALDSASATDRHLIEQISSWFKLAFDRGCPVDFEAAKAIFKNSKKLRSAFRAQRTASIESDCWALKTTSGHSREDHWSMFKSKKVVAIGWPDVPGNPAKLSDADLRLLIARKYEKPKRSTDLAASTIKKFTNLKIGDKILICRGYVGPQRKPVHIYGVGTIMGPFRVEPGHGPNGDSCTKQRYAH